MCHSSEVDLLSESVFGFRNAKVLCNCGLFVRSENLWGIQMELNFVIFRGKYLSFMILGEYFSHSIGLVLNSSCFSGFVVSNIPRCLKVALFFSRTSNFHVWFHLSAVQERLICSLSSILLPVKIVILFIYLKIMNLKVMFGLCSLCILFSFMENNKLYYQIVKAQLKLYFLTEKFHKCDRSPCLLFHSGVSSLPVYVHLDYSYMLATFCTPSLHCYFCID